MMRQGGREGREGGEGEGRGGEGRGGEGRGGEGRGGEGRGGEGRRGEGREGGRGWDGRGGNAIEHMQRPSAADLRPVSQWPEIIDVSNTSRIT